VSSLVAFFFTAQITLIHLSKNLPFFFTPQNNPIKMFRVLFLRSDRSDFAGSKATERLDKPTTFVFTFLLQKISCFEGFSPAFK